VYRKQSKKTIWSRAKRYYINFHGIRVEAGFTAQLHLLRVSFIFLMYVETLPRYIYS